MEYCLSKRLDSWPNFDEGFDRGIESSFEYERRIFVSIEEMAAEIKRHGDISWSGLANDDTDSPVLFYANLGEPEIDKNNWETEIVFEVGEMNKADLNLLIELTHK